MDSDAQFIKETTDLGFGGDNQSINVRLDSPFNMWTRQNNDMCGYVNQIRIMRKPLKYYVNKEWAPAPTNGEHFSTFTAVGNQTPYGVTSNLNYPGIGNPTSLGNRRFIEYVMPLASSPDLGNNAIGPDTVDINSRNLNFGIGELTNPRILPKDVTTATDYNRWAFVDPKIVQNPDHIIFAGGVIPQGGISSRNELQNYILLNKC